MTTDTKSPKNSGPNPPRPNPPGPKPPGPNPFVSHPRSGAEPASEPAKPAAGWTKLASPKYLGALAAVVIVANATAFFVLRMRSTPPPPAKRSQEMILGTFEYSRVNPRDKQIKHGQIVVTLHLEAALDAAKFREVHRQEKELQATAEEALRRVRASDLADPRFVRLRNRFQERLNEELGFDGIEEVTVTNVPEPAAAPQAASEEADASPDAPADESQQAAPSPNAAGN